MRRRSVANAIPKVEMNEREHSGLRDLVTVIAVCGFILLAALTALLAQNWFGSLKDWLTVAPSTEQGGKAPQGPTATWTDMEIKAALMQCIKAAGACNR